MVISDSITQVNCGSYSLLKFDDKEGFMNTVDVLANGTITSHSLFYHRRHIPAIQD